MSRSKVTHDNLYIPKPKMNICVLSDQMHIDKAKENGQAAMSADDLKMNIDKKLVIKLGKFSAMLPHISNMMIP